MVRYGIVRYGSRITPPRPNAPQISQLSLSAIVACHGGSRTENPDLLSVCQMLFLSQSQLPL